MGHKRKVRRHIQKPPKAEEKPSRGKLILVIAIVFILVLVPVLLILTSEEPSSNGNGPPHFEIIFPRDEGRHNDSIEFWKLDLLLKDQASNEFSINIDYYLREAGLPERVATVTDEGNISGTEFLTGASTGDINIGQEKLNLTFDSTQGSDSWNGVYSDVHEYTYQGLLDQGAGEVYYLDLQMVSTKAPVLLGDKGLIELESGGNVLGTIKGYIISRLTVTGSMRLKGDTYVVSGYAWIEHEWGAWTIQNMEEFRLQLSTASELFSVRFYHPTEDQIIKELVYYSGPGGQIVELGPEQFSLENRRYWMDTRFPSAQGRCLPSKWHFASTTITSDITSEATTSNQIERYHWEGSLAISGLIEGVVGTGRGFAILNHPYYSTPDVLAFYKDDTIPTLPDMYANITNQIPMDNATVYYQVNGGTWKGAAMTYVGDNIWKGTISLSFGNNVRARVEAYDLAGNKVVSEELVWTV